MSSNTVLENELLAMAGEMPVLDRQKALEELKRLRSNVMKSREIPFSETAAVLDKCARVWLNREYSGRHIEILSKITNQSPELVTVELEGTMKMLLRENIERTVRCELGGSGILDGWVSTEYGKVCRKPRGVLFHNISGNAFIVIPVSISMGLISKNCNFVKVSRDEPYFAYALFKSLCEIDDSIKDRLSVSYFDSSDSDIYDAVIGSSDCVLHWGGIESEKSISALCSNHRVKLVTHGPKISFEVVDSFTGDPAPIAGKIAMDMMAWEQKACLSPRVLFINKKLDAEEFTRKLADSLQLLTARFPKAYLNEWNSIKTIQDRQYCIEKYGLASGVKVYSSYNADYTVLLTSEMPDKNDINRCFYRFIFVCPYENPSEVESWVKTNIKPYLQTMGYTGSDEQFIDRMAMLGITTITKPGEMSLHAPGTSHDGFSNLTELTYAVSSQL
ncbi:MAG TPA: acyl-CoA reductase [Ruminiclostridium sp.]|nr:acyl-CoA reductase [Ruminiclostridium sp.]